jgi:uncharacterized membrane protein YoaK (UPF0700 family)
MSRRPAGVVAMPARATEGGTMDDVFRESWIRRHERDLMLLALTWAAGNIDAIGYLGLGRVFTANMTGNTVLLGLHLGQEQGGAALRAFVALLSFGVGLVMGALIVERIRGAGPWPPAVTWALALEAAMLAAFAVGMYLTASLREVIEAQALIAVSAIAMGIQSAAVRRLNVPGIATTYVTGTLTTAVTSLIAGSRGAKPALVGASERVEGVPAAGHWWRGVRLQLFALLLYGFGATVGGLVYERWPALVAVLPFVAVAVVVAAAARAGMRG